MKILKTRLINEKFAITAAPLATGFFWHEPAAASGAAVAIQFIPLLAVVGVIAAFTWRRPPASVPGALICALLISWYMTSGTANHRQPGFEPQLPGASARR